MKNIIVVLMLSAMFLLVGCGSEEEEPLWKEGHVPTAERLKKSLKNSEHLQELRKY